MDDNNYKRDSKEPSYISPKSIGIAVTAVKQIQVLDSG